MTIFSAFAAILTISFENIGVIGIDFNEVNGKHKVTGQPGVGDVTKRCLYQLAYDDFITKQG